MRKDSSRTADAKTRTLTRRADRIRKSAALFAFIAFAPDAVRPFG